MRRGALVALTAALLLAVASCATTDDSSTSDGTPSGASSEVAKSAPVSAPSRPSGPGTSPTSAPGSGRPVQANATVDRIVDGDTLVVRVGSQRERLRLIGINTPESVDPNRPVMCFGKEASKHLGALVPPGTPVRIERDVEPRDKYGRLLGYLYRANDGLFVNLAQVTDGYANQFTFPPNVAHVDEFKRAAARARAGRTGLWGACPAPFEK